MNNDIVAITPGNLYLINIIINININPIIPALTVLGIASAPSVGPTVLTEIVFNVTGNAPDCIILATLLASSKLLLPSITASPSVISVLTTGFVNT